jgi:hypothetical protein
MIHEKLASITPFSLTGAEVNDHPQSGGLELLSKRQKHFSAFNGALAILPRQQQPFVA